MEVLVYYNNSQSTKLFDVQEVEVYKIIENKIN